MNFLNMFTKTQLLRYYANIGSIKSSLNIENSFYLLGFYKKISFINLNKILINIKKKINFLIKFSKTKLVTNFIIINLNQNKLLVKRYLKSCIKLKCSYYNGSWWNGLFKNFKRYINYNSSKKKKFKFFSKKYPNFSVCITKQKINEFDYNSTFINKEMNSVSMLNLTFFDTNFNIDKNLGSILSNTKSNVNNLFLFNLSLKIIKKCLFINKKFFFNYIFSKYKILKTTKIKLFYESNFCLKKKKKLFKNTLWDGDLN